MDFRCAVRENSAFCEKFSIHRGSKGKFIFQIIREQWYYNKGLQEVVTSIHFVKIKTIFFAKLPGLEPNPVGLSQIFSLMLGLLSYWSLGVNNCLTNPFMPEFNWVEYLVIILYYNVTTRGAGTLIVYNDHISRLTPCCLCLSMHMGTSNNGLTLW